mgnify:CR=1 FL=1
MLFCCASKINAQQLDDIQPLGVVAFYNLENLFDTQDDSLTRDEDFLPDGRYGWTDERYRQKLGQMSKAIQGMNGGPDILGVCEVENRKVLEDLVKQPALAANRYQIVHFESPDYRGIDVGLLYKPTSFIPFFTETIPFPKDPDDPRFKTRDILHVKGLFQKMDTLHIFVNHWPSRRGGKEDKRIMAGKLLRQHADSILAINPDAKMVMMGDFNDDPANKSIKEELKAVTKERKAKDGNLFNTSASAFKQGYGTLGYRGVFNLFDQMIVSPGLLQKNSDTFYFIPKSYKIFSAASLQWPDGEDKGFPMRTFHRGVYHPEGFSDHYPVLIVLGQDR